jgi:hypothetical protein
VVKLGKLGGVLTLALLTPQISNAFCLQPLASSRLQVFCMVNILNSKATDSGSVKLLDHRLKQEGYSRGLGLPGMVKQTTFSPYAWPILDYSSDINGGNPDKPLQVGSLTFYGDKDYIRKRGVLIGVGVSGKGRAIYGQGKYADFGVGGTVSYSPKHAIGIVGSFANVCSKNDIGKDFFLDGCVTTNRVKKDLTDQETGSASLSIAKLFSEGETRFHQGSLGVQHHKDNEYEQNQIIMKLETVDSANLFSSFDILFGDKIKNTLTTRRSVSTTVGTSLFDKPISLSISYSLANGGKLLGVSRQETTKLISFKYAIHPRLSLRLGYRLKNSNIDYFDENEAIVAVQFAPIRF